MVGHEMQLGMVEKLNTIVGGPALDCRIGFIEFGFPKLKGWILTGQAQEKLSSMRISHCQNAGNGNGRFPQQRDLEAANDDDDDDDADADGPPCVICC